MVMRGASLVLVLVLAVAAGPAFGTKQDGRPRPTGYPDLPTTAYGPLPPCYNASTVVVTCEWYGFADIKNPTLGADCNANMRALLSNTTAYPPGMLEPYVYYSYYYYYYYNYYYYYSTYCLYGCFDLSSSAAAPPPVALNSRPPPSTRVINVNGAGFLRPTGFVSFVLSGALLIRNGLAAF